VVPRADRQLFAEAVALGAILGVVLTLAALERCGPIPWLSGASALALLILGVWYVKRFGTAPPWFPAMRAAGYRSLRLPVTLIGLVVLAAWLPLLPSIPPELSLIQALNLLVLVPVAEEFFFRGLLLDHLRRGSTTRQAVWICSFLFAVLHIPSGGVLSAGVLSLLACALVVKTGALASAIQLHVAWNALSQILCLGDSSLRWNWAIAAAVCIALLAVGSWCWRPKAPVG